MFRWECMWLAGPRGWGGSPLCAQALDRQGTLLRLRRLLDRLLEAAGRQGLLDRHAWLSPGLSGPQHPHWCPSSHPSIPLPLPPLCSGINDFGNVGAEDIAAALPFLKKQGVPFFVHAEVPHAVHVPEVRPPCH